MRVSETSDPVTKVAQDLRAIEDMGVLLLTQAVHKANDRDIPGGNAMVALAPVANPEAWEHRYEASEERGAGDYVEDQDATWEPPLQTLLFWSGEWRREHGHELDRRPTITSEAAFIRWALNWAWENEPHFADFARDIRSARARLEAELREGEQIERGAPCLYDACKGERLTRQLVREKRRWVWTGWKCGRCQRTWTDDRYAAMVTAANEAAKTEQIDAETWSTIEYAARDVGRSVKTIRTWITAGKVSEACIIAGRRKKFVNLDQVRREDTRAGRRARKSA